MSDAADVLRYSNTYAYDGKSHVPRIELSITDEKGSRRRPHGKRKDETLSIYSNNASTSSATQQQSQRPSRYARQFPENYMIEVFNDHESSVTENNVSFVEYLYVFLDI